MLRKSSEQDVQQHPLPARLTDEQTARRLGFQKHDIPVLISAGLLKPLGKPAANAHKYFAAVEVESLAVDTKWLAKATQVVYDIWRTKNHRRFENETATAV
jgi:hypothetical protein